MHLLSTSRYLICSKYNSNFACNLAENCRLQLCAFLTSHSQKKKYSFMFLRQILSCYNLKNFFSKLVKVLVLVLELFYSTRTRVHFSISVLVLVLEVFCGTRTRARTRKLSTRLHHWLYTKHTGSAVTKAYERGVQEAHRHKLGGGERSYRYKFTRSTT